MSSYYNAKEKIWYGKKVPSKYGPKDSIGSVVLKFLLEEPERIAQISHQTGYSMTCLEMAKLSIQTYSYLENFHLQQGDIIGMCAANSDFVTPVVLGSLMAGLSISTMDPSFDGDGIKHIYSQTKPKIMFCDGDIYEKVKKAFDECGLSSSRIFIIHKFIEGVPSVREFFVNDVNIKDFRVPPLKNGLDQRAFVVCSSGTTGMPKAVSTSHAFLLSVEESPLQHRIHFCFSSLYWLTGIVTLTRSIRSRSTRVITENPFSPEEFLNIIQTHKVNDVLGPPSHIGLTLASDKLPQSDLSSIETYMCGGSAVPHTLIEKFKKFAPNVEFTIVYGMTESVLFVTMGESEPGDSVGFVKENREVKIIDDNGLKVGPNTRGEICARSPFHWEGYYGNDEATKAVYDNEKWFHSGDVGFFNEEGKLFVVDRKKDILKCNNFHFSPTWIEKVINELPVVHECCVVGIPDETYGFLPAAAVIKQTESDVTESDICDYVKNRMQHFEQLRGGVYFVKTFPRTVSGKILRREVTKMCQKLFEEMKMGKKEKLSKNFVSKTNVKFIS